MRQITIKDLYSFEWFVDPALSPDGSQYALTRSYCYEETKEYRAQVYLAPTIPGGVPRQITNGTRDTTPRWSPDGSKLAFVSNRAGGNQIWLLNMAGGEATQLTFMRNGAGNPVWSPDGTKIAFSARMHRDDELDKMYKPITQKEREDAAKYKREHALIVDNLHYRTDGAGFFDNYYAHIWVLQLSDGKITRLTEGNWQHGGFSWAPCSSKLVFSAARANKPDGTTAEANLWIAPASGGELHQLTLGDQSCMAPSWSPDGKNIAYLSSLKEPEWGDLGGNITRIWLIPAAGGETKCITAQADHGFNERMYTDMSRDAGSSTALTWFPCGSKILATSNRYGGIYLHSIGIDGKVEQLSSGERHVFGWSLHPNGKEVLVGWSDPLKVGEFSLLKLEDKSEELLYSSNTWLKDVHLSETSSYWCKGDEGLDLQCWVMKPIGWQEGKKYPLLHIIHGGPANMYGFTFNHTFQLMAASGYYVFYTNPRGGLGYGQKFQQGVILKYGEGDYRDLMLALDHAIATDPGIDADRLGVTGISYGGFMTNWIVGHTDRYKAAITEASISNWVSFFGCSDIGYSFCDSQHGANPLTDYDEMLKRSPITYVKNVVTPLLISHNEEDYRCPIEQGEQLFVALKKLGQTVRLVRFPHSSHSLPGSGNPALREDRLKHFMDWFNTYIDIKKEDYKV
ncbi:MAG: S9 family peptidase [Symbiobacteriaceae bacterium]|nr:S9 family peptidase [Symbiobacteriaceae bacterium]